MNEIENNQDIIQKGTSVPWERIVGKLMPGDERHVTKVSITDLEFNRNASVDRAYEYLHHGSFIDNSNGILSAARGLRGISIYFAVGSIGLGAGLVLGRVIFGC